MRVESLVTITNNLNAAGVRYLVAGGLAVIAHGYARLTMDLDIIVALDSNNVKNALIVFETLGYRPRVPVEMMKFADPACRETWINDKNMVVFSLIPSNPVFPVIDLFVREPFDFDYEIQRAEAFRIAPDTNMPVVSLPTLIRMKEQTGRQKDSLDVSCLKQLLTGKDNEENGRT
jgi:hypothetical protein